MKTVNFIKLLLFLCISNYDGFSQNDSLIVSYQKIVLNRKPDIIGKNVKVWTIEQTEKIRINLVEMTGELLLHKHPDASHSLVVLEGKVKVKAGNEILILKKGDYISIPSNMPHKYWSLTKKSLLMSMDSPYYDSKKTIQLE
jgi:quercetin dioxygenase-like cupin family protein